VLRLLLSAERCWRAHVAVIAKNILNKRLLDQERNFICGAGQRFWKLRDGFIEPARNAFKLLDQPATSTAAFSG
jgi:hypothetical protein